jgi:ketosteroid isomerase-like protein
VQQAAQIRAENPRPDWENNYPFDLRTRSGLPSDTPMLGPATQLSKQGMTLFGPGRVVIAWILLALCALPAVTQAKLPLAQKHEIRHEIDQLEDAWRVAVLKGNTSALEGLLADDYLAITASGTLQNKAETLDNLRQGRTKFSALDLSDRKVRFYGTTALVTSIAEVDGTAGDSELKGSFRYTRVYVRNAQGNWKIVSFEVSKIREPGDRADHK